MQTASSVIRLLNLLSAIRDISPFNRLDAEEELMLNELILRWNNQEKVTVRDVLHDARYPSSSTAYRRLAGLQTKGIVTFAIANEDRRLRYVIPQEAALRYISRLEAGVENLVKDSACQAA